MNGLTVDADIDPSEDLLGKSVEDLQEDIQIGARSIAGTLKYIDDYSSAGYAGDEVSGNFIALHCEVPDTEDVTITVEVVGGVHGPTTLDADGLVIARIANKSSQTIKVVASKEGYKSVVKTYRLNGLDCEGPNSEG